MIERNLFFYWEGPRLPDIYDNSIRYITAVNPEYEVALVDGTCARDRLKDLAPRLEAIFDDILIPAVKSDIMRMAILHKFGGWYLDCDSRPRVGLDHWGMGDHDLALKYVVVNGKMSVHNSIIGGAAGHGFFAHSLRLMERVVVDRLTHYSVYRSTGPDLCLLSATPFLRAESTRFDPMDYELIDVIQSPHKGTWTFQECCGLWANDTDPVVFRPHVELARIERLDALAYFRRMFDRFAATQADNYKKLMLRAGVHYVHKHGISDEILSLSERFVPNGERAYYNRLHDKLAEQKDEAGLARLARIMTAPAANPAP